MYELLVVNVRPLRRIEEVMSELHAFYTTPRMLRLRNQIQTPFALPSMTDIHVCVYLSIPLLFKALSCSWFSYMSSPRFIISDGRNVIYTFERI
jgi:hypothetical protein